MTRFVRQLLLACGLLCLFFLASLWALHWVNERSDDARHEALGARRLQLDAALKMLPAGAALSDPAVTQQLGAVIGANLRFEPAPATAISGTTPGASRAAALPEPTAAAARAERSRWAFEYPVFDANRVPVGVLHATLVAPPAARLAMSALRAVLIITLTALALVTLATLSALLARRNAIAENDDDRPAPRGGREELAGLTQLAKVSARQGAELERERSQRQLAENDLQLKQQMLERAFADKVQMGRDLHDGIIQSLYAAGLTLQTAKRQVTAKPEEATRLLDAGLQTLNATIGEIRRYISGLTTAGLRQATFQDSVQELTSVLGAGREVDFELRIDDDAAQQLDESQFAELLQVVREAASNGLRHGGARHLIVRLHRQEGEICLLVQDNGCGFDAKRLPDRGHGLANMQARAQRLGGTLRFHSAPGQGTRLVLTFAASNRVSA